MTRRRWLHATIASGAVFTALFGALACAHPHPRLLWNASASAPIGLYRLHPGAKISLGDRAAVTPPASLARFLADRRYLPSGLPLLKRVAALPGAVICRHDAAVTINGRMAALARDVDRHQRPLPVWQGCHVLGSDELFLLGDTPDSMDGRYFGPIPASGLLGLATPLLTRAAPAAPLRLRAACPQGALPHLSERSISCR